MSFVVGVFRSLSLLEFLISRLLNSTRLFFRSSFLFVFDFSSFLFMGR